MEPPPITATITVQPTADGQIAVTLQIHPQSADLLHNAIDNAVIASERTS